MNLNLPGLQFLFETSKATSSSCELCELSIFADFDAVALDLLKKYLEN